MSSNNELNHLKLELKKINNQLAIKPYSASILQNLKRKSELQAQKDIIKAKIKKQVNLLEKKFLNQVQTKKKSLENPETTKELLNEINKQLIQLRNNYINSRKLFNGVNISNQLKLTKNLENSVRKYLPFLYDEFPPTPICRTNAPQSPTTPEPVRRTNAQSPSTPEEQKVYRTNNLIYPVKKKFNRKLLERLGVTEKQLIELIAYEKYLRKHNNN